MNRKNKDSIYTEADESISPVNKLTIKLIDYVIKQKFVNGDQSLYYNSKDTWVKLSSSLADHIISMVEKTDWAFFVNDSTTVEPSLPYLTWEDKDIADFKSHIGETISISCFGDPWPDIIKEETLISGVQIAFAENLLFDAMVDLKDVFTDMSGSAPGIDAMIALNNAIALFKENGAPDEIIFNIFLKNMEELKY